MGVAGVVLLLVTGYLPVALSSDADAKAAADTAVPPAQPASAVDEQSLVRFAAAYLAVEAIRESFEGRIKQTESIRTRDQLALEANRRMAEAIDVHDLTVERYNDIARATHVNETLRERLLDELARLTTRESSD